MMLLHQIIYDIDSIEARIVNGDGAGWIKAGTDEERVYYHLDLFHKSQAIIRNVRSKKDRKKLIKMLADKFSKRLYKTIEEEYSSLIPESKLNKIIKTADLSAADVNFKALNCKIYKCYINKYHT